MQACILYHLDVLLCYTRAAFVPCEALIALSVEKPQSWDAVVQHDE